MYPETTFSTPLIRWKTASTAIEKHSDKHRHRIDQTRTLNLQHQKQPPPSVATDDIFFKEIDLQV